MKKRFLAIALVLCLIAAMIPTAGATLIHNGTYYGVIFDYRIWGAHLIAGEPVSMIVGANVPFDRIAELSCGLYGEDRYCTLEIYSGIYEGYKDSELPDDAVPVLTLEPRKLKTDGYYEEAYTWDSKGLPLGAYTAYVLVTDKDGNPIGNYNLLYACNPFYLVDKAVPMTGVTWMDWLDINNEGYYDCLTDHFHMRLGEILDEPTLMPLPAGCTNIQTSTYSTTTPDILSVETALGSARITALQYGYGTLVGKLGKYTGYATIEICRSSSGHSFGEAILTPATETAYGTKEYTCRFCSYSCQEQYHDCSSEGYTDVPAAPSWAHLPIDFVVSHGIMTGTTETTFEPKSPFSRGQIVTVLHRMVGSPKAEAQAPFTDLTKKYYLDAIAWAYENGIVTGFSDTVFGPDKAVTREELATILYRFYTEYQHKTPVAGADLSAFPDYASIHNYAKDAVAWAVAVGIIEGSGGSLIPRSSAIRSQAAAIFMRYMTLLPQ